MAAEPLRIATEGAYPPFNDVDDNGNLVGFDVDIAMALCTAMERECTIEPIKWNNLIETLNTGKVDAIVASMAKTEERERQALFTDFYYRSRAAFIGDPTKRHILTQEGMVGKTLASQENTVHEQYIRDNFGATANVKVTKTTGDSFKLLTEGKANMVLSDSLTSYVFLQTDAGKRFDFIWSLPVSDSASNAHIAVRQSDTNLANEFNAALKAIRLSGEYDRINRKFFPFSIY